MSNYPKLLVCTNGEPDGRLYVYDDDMRLIFKMLPHHIDLFARLLLEHCGSDGDGEAFQIDPFTGESKLVWWDAYGNAHPQDDEGEKP